MRAFVMDRHLEGFSPETIAIRLKNYGPMEDMPSLSHGAIYQWLCKSTQKKQRLFKLLVRHHAKRGRRKRPQRGPIKDRVSYS